ncbi:MAG: N-acetyl sugar amidotransferase [Thermodesulfobacteriota bacterium]
MHQPLFEGKLRYCVRCCIPETEDGASFDELGICQACRSSEEKMHIDWAARERQLRAILEEAKANAGTNYDCIVPISGGKDSTFQLHVLCKVYGMKPLAVTFNHNWFSETGWYNLLNSLETFNVDHIMFTPNRDLVNRLARRSVEIMGDTCWHCHMGCGTFPYQVALKFRIPLLVYGEPSAEGHNLGSYLKPIEYDKNYFLNVSARRTPDEIVCPYISSKDVYPFQLPSDEECETFTVKGIHLGSYVFWDDERQTELVRDTYGWRETEMEQAYKRYKSAECIMPGMHDFTCYLKRGYARGTVQATLDVRCGLLTRDEGFDLVQRVDPVRPEALDYFLEITGMSESEFYERMEKQRLGVLKGIPFPVLSKSRPNRERILPFARQIIERFRGERNDPYVTDPVGSCRGPEKAPPESSSFFDFSVGRILDLYRKKELSPVDVAHLCIRRVQEKDVLAWEVFDPDSLLQQARECETRLLRGEPLRRLEGIPIGIKDVFNTRDFPTQMGSPLWKGFTPGNDARAVFYLRQAGGVIPGKTVTAEFAVHTLGKTLNPHDPSRTPGTSSSGSAAAIATAMVPLAMGTQTAGSIARPSSFCGIYGCKPSFGLIPRTAILKTTDSLDTVGFFALWYEDLKRLFDVVTVKGENYPLSHAALTDPVRQRKPEGRPWRVLLARTHTWNHAEEYAKSALTRWAEKLAATGRVEILEDDLPAISQDAHEIHATIYDKTLSYYFREEYRKSELVSPVMNRLIEHGQSLTPEQYRKALQDQLSLARDMDGFLSRYDALVSLTTAGSAPLRQEVEKPDPCLLWTMTFLPVVCVPAFSNSNGMPFGLQVAARRYNDPLLFRFCDDLFQAGMIPPAANPPLR